MYAIGEKDLDELREVKSFLNSIEEKLSTGAILDEEEAREAKMHANRLSRFLHDCMELGS